MSGENDKALVERALAGDSRAFDDVMRRIEPDLRRYLSAQISSRPEASVDEALQDLRIYLFRRLDRYDPQYPFVVFARGLAKNIARRHVFKKSDLVPRPSGETDDEDRWSDDLSPRELEPLPANFQAVLGKDRYDSPEGPPPPSRVFLELLEIYLRYGGYPHQQVAFGYSILIWGKAKARPRTGASRNPEEFLAPAGEKVPVTGDPDRVVQDVGPRPLNGSCREMIDEIGRSAALDQPFLERATSPLWLRLQMTGAELFCRDSTSRRLFAHLAGRNIGKTKLGEYFGKDQRKSVADWTRTVKERIKKVFSDPSTADRIPLPGP